MSGPIADLYGGPGGWSEGLRLLSPDLHRLEVGFEWSAHACATRAAAGHRTIRCDVGKYPIPRELTGPIASPPCPQFSFAGAGAGRLAMAELIAAVNDALAGKATLARHRKAMARAIRAGLAKANPKATRRELSASAVEAAAEAAHTVQPARWIHAGRPEWIALEQVPAVLPIWQAYAEALRKLGYSVWCGILNAADYGVPQTRQRAILIASRVRIVHPPERTHEKDPVPSLFGQLERWVTMAEALGWGDTDRPATAIVTAKDGGNPIDGGSNSRAARRKRIESGSFLPVEKGERRWPWHLPATTIAGDPRITARCHHDDGSQGRDAKTTAQARAGDYAGTEPIRLTPTEALVLQSFRPDYPVAGGRSAQFMQIGNAVPPVLAAHVASAATGITLTLPHAAIVPVPPENDDPPAQRSTARGTTSTPRRR